MATSSVPVPTFGPNGFIAPSEGAILAGVQADTDAAFGGGLNPALETPQGQLASSETAIIGDKNDQFLFYTNQVDPAFASGRMQDAIGRIYFLERTAAEPTSVLATCVGLAGTVIPIGALAQATDGNIYACVDGGTIPVGGSLTLAFANTLTGPVPCPAHALNVIYQAIPGWDTIDNPADGVLGSAVETRADFEARRSASVALNARNTNGSVRGVVLNVPNVLDAYVIDNPTAAPVTLQGVAIAAHSIYICVAGGEQNAIAKAIFTKKPPGCGMVGATTVTVEDDSDGYSPPYPDYSISYQIAAPVALTFVVTITNSSAVPSNAATLVKNAILAAFSGGDGGPRAKIGATVYASRFFGPVVALGAWAQVVSLTINAGNSVSVDIDQIPTLAAADITVTLV